MYGAEGVEIDSLFDLAWVLWARDHLGSGEPHHAVDALASRYSSAKQTNSRCRSLLHRIRDHDSHQTE